MQGPSESVCGQTISAANVGQTPWFVDRSKTGSDSAVQFDPLHPVWVQLSSDCATGVDMPFIGPDDSVAKIDTSVAATGAPGHVVAVHLIGLSSGSATLTIPGATLSAVQLQVS